MEHLIISSYMNPLAGLDNLTTLAAGLFEKEVVDLLAESLGFTYEVKRPSDDLDPDKLLPNGSWTGCTGQIERQEIDLCVSFSWESTVILKGVDYTYPIIWDGISMLMPAPQKVSKNLLLLLLPFSTEVWACLLVTSFLAIVILWLAHKDHKDLGSRLSLSRWLLFVTAALTNGERGFFLHGLGNTSTKNSFIYRLLTLGWVFPVQIVVIKLYCNFILSMLAMPDYCFLVHEIVDLPRRPDVRVYVFKDSITEHFFTGITQGEFKGIGDQIRENPQQRLPLFDVTKVVDIIREGNSVFLGTGAICRSIVEKDLLNNSGEKTRPQRLFQSNAPFYSMGRQMTLPKNSRLTKILNNQILVLHEHGLIEKAYLQTVRILGDQLKRKAGKEDDRKALNRKDLSGPFFLFVNGIIISIFVVLGELIYTRFLLSIRIRLKETG